MRRFSFIAASLLVVQSPTLAQQASPAATAPTQEPATRVVPLYQSARYVMAMLTIGEGTPSPVIFDTGTSGFAIDQIVADRLKLKTVGSVQVMDGATRNVTTVPLVLLRNAKMGGIPLGEVEAEKWPTPREDSIGLMGPYAFSGHLVTVELGHSRFRLSPATEAPDGTPYAYEESLPTIDVMIAGKPAKAHLDSGNSGDLILPKTMMSSLPLKAGPWPGRTARSALGTQQFMAAQLRGDIQIGPLTLRDPIVDFGAGHYVNVGAKLLRQMTFAVDPKRQLTWIFDPATDRLPLSAYAGAYGERNVRVQDRVLLVDHGKTPTATFRPVGSGLFENPASGERIQFQRAGGRATGLLLITGSGRVSSFPRTS